MRIVDTNGLPSFLQIHELPLAIVDDFNDFGPIPTVEPKLVAKDFLVARARGFSLGAIFSCQRRVDVYDVSCPFLLSARTRLRARAPVRPRPHCALGCRFESGGADTERGLHDQEAREN